jgi:two-component system response regulator
VPDILLVEDRADDIELTLRAFARQRPIHSVSVAKDGEEALEFLFAEGRYGHLGPEELPGLVLLDLNLPKLSGVEVLQRVRAHERTRVLPVVMLTTSTEPSDLSACYSSGANSFVVKPIDYQDFVEVVSQLERYWLGLNRGPVNPGGRFKPAA